MDSKGPTVFLNIECSEILYFPYQKPLWQAINGEKKPNDLTRYLNFPLIPTKQSLH
jgi:hypothetical protein